MKSDVKKSFSIKASLLALGLFLIAPMAFAAFPPTVENTATVAVPAGVTDPTPGNNSDNDINNLMVGSISGTITQDTTGDGVGDTPLPATVELFAADAAGNPTGLALDTVVSADGSYTFADVPVGNYVVVETDPANYVSVSDTQSPDDDVVANTNTNDNQIPVSILGADNDAGNNFVDTNLADLEITKTDGVATYTPGQPVTYTIVATNNGPNSADGATVADAFPAGITSATWTCVAAGGAACPNAAGTGNINEVIASLPNGGSVTYTVTAQTDPAATGDLVNTATITSPAGAPDPTPANNTDTDTDTPDAQADLSITKDDSMTDYVPGTTGTYTIVVNNAGPSNVTGASVTDTLPLGVTLTGPVTCVATGAASCGAPSIGAAGGLGFSDNADIEAGAGNFVTYTVPVTYSTDMADYVP